MKKQKIQRIIVILIAIAVSVFVPELINSQNTTDIDLNSNTDNNDIATIDTELEEQDTKLDAVKFVRTVDGDTIIVEDSSGEHKRVRMIGIDTPESVAKEEERNNEYGVMSSDFTKKLLTDAQTLYLEYDIDDDDQYDRILAYLWLEDVSDTFDEENIENSMVNAIIVENGYGIAKRYEPTVAHDDILQQLTEEARVNNVGLWQYEGFRKLWMK